MKDTSSRPGAGQAEWKLFISTYQQLAVFSRRRKTTQGFGRFDKIPSKGAAWIS
jgi:hypothetical protein